VQKAGARAEDFAALATAYEKAGRPAEAAGALARGISAGFAAPGVNQRLGRLCEAAGQFDKAAIAYKSASAEVGITPDEAAARAVHAANVMNHYLLDGLRANKEYLALAKQWPRTPPARAALLGVWDGGDRNNEEVRVQRGQALELLLRQFPADPALAGHLNEFLVRARSNPRLALEVYDAVVAAQPTFAENPAIAGNHGMVLHGAGQNDAANQRLIFAFSKTGDVNWLYQGGSVAPPAQRAVLWSMFAEKATWHQDSPGILWAAQEAKLAPAECQRIAGLLLPVWSADGERLAIIQAVLARAETDPGKQVEHWKQVLKASPWTQRDLLANTAVANPALAEAVGQVWQEQRAKSDGVALATGNIYGYATASTAGEDAAKLEKARDIYATTLIGFGLIWDDHARWMADRLHEAFRHASFDADKVESTYLAILAAPLSTDLRRHIGERAAEAMNWKGQPERGAKLRERAQAKPEDPLHRTLAEATEGTHGERSKKSLELTRNAEVMGKLSPALQNWLRGVARWNAEHDGEMRNKIPEITREFYGATKDPNWGIQYAQWTTAFNRADLLADLDVVAGELLAGPAKGNASVAFHTATMRARAGRWKDAADVMLSTLNRPFETWSNDELANYCTWVARGGDRDNYAKALRAMMAKGDWDRVWRGVLWEHGLPDDMKWPLNEEVIKTCPRRDIQAECLLNLAVAQRGGDQAGCLKTLGRIRDEFPDALSQYQRGLIVMLQLSQERKDEELEKRCVQELYKNVVAHGMVSDGNQFGDAMMKVIQARLAGWDKEGPAKALQKKQQWFGFLLDHGGCSGYTTWAARNLYDLKRTSDPIEGGLLLNRLVRTGWRDAPDQFDRVLAEVTAEMNAGRYGLAAGAFQHMAKWFEPTRVGAERIQLAQRLATGCLGKLGVITEIDERDPRAPLLRAAAFIATGDESEAYRMATQHLQLLEDNLGTVSSDLVLLVARNQIREEKFTQSRRLLSAYQRQLGDAAASADAAARTRYLIGEASFHEGNSQVALLEYQAVVASWPKSPTAIDAALRVGDCFYAQRQAGQARSAYEQLLFNDDREVRIKAKFRLAVLASEEQQQDEAFRMFREIAADNPPKDLANQLYLDWGKLLIGASRLKEAEDVITLVGLSTNREPVTPGEPLRITLRDTYLQASQNRTSVPVLVASSNGDREEIELTLSQDIKGLFTGSIPTVLGKATPGNRMLEVGGNASISYDYTPDFKLGRANLVMGAGDIGIAANAELKASSSAEDTAFVLDSKQQKAKSLDKLLASFDATSMSKAREIAASKSRTFRNNAEIKPGNPFYVAVRDPDQDLSDEADEVVALVEAAGDRVQVKLTESEAHSGIFQATVKTGLKPADLRVSDSAPGSDPLVMVMQPQTPGYDQADKAWIALGDQQPGKTVTIDLKSMTTMDRFAWSRGKRVQTGPVAPAVPVEGLSASWFRGVDLSGPAAHRSIGAPSFTGINVPNIGTDNYSDRWVGEINIPEQGTWTLGLVGDDGVRLTIDGKRVVDAWVGQGATLHKADVELTAGWHPVIAEHFQGNGGSHLELVMAKAGVAPTPVPVNQLRSTSGGAGVGAFGVDRRITSYRLEISATGKTWTPIYDLAPRANAPMAGRLDLAAQPTRRPVRSTREALEMMSRIRPGAPLANAKPVGAAKFDTALPKAADDKPKPADDKAKAEKADWLADGLLLIPAPGTYEFAVAAGGRCWMTIDDQLVIEKERDEAAGEGEPRWRGRVEDLPFGLVPIRLLANSDSGLSGVQLLWKPPGAAAFVPIPDAALNAAAKPSDISTFTGQTLASASWFDDRYGSEVRFPKVATRFLRMVIMAWEDGDAPAVASVRVHDGDQLVMPKQGIDYKSLAENEVLELSAGGEVSVSYLDERNKKGQVDTVRSRLAVTYYNGGVRFLDARNRVIDGQLQEELFERYRFRIGERLSFQVVDYDLDVSDKPDTVEVSVSTAQGAVTVVAKETKPASGVFQGEIKTVRAGEPAGADVLAVKEGEQVIATYLDSDNTAPGAPTKRSSAVRE
nr:hypothetical protein [Planctomycetota bacterium]